MGQETSKFEEKRVPRKALWFTDKASMADVSKPIAGESPRFSMLAASGQPYDHWYWGRMAIDLAGAQISQKMPALRDHNTDQVVGYTDLVEKRSDGLYAEGPILAEEEAAKTVLRLASQNFPWQASVYCPPSSIQILEDGEEAEINGYTFKGPGAIFRQSMIREVSFCVLGADPQTMADANKDGDEVTVRLERKVIDAMNETNATQETPETPAQETPETQETQETPETPAPAPETGQNSTPAILAERNRCRSILTDAFAFAARCGSREGMNSFAQAAVSAIDSGNDPDASLRKFHQTMDTLSFSTQGEKPGAQPLTEPGDRFGGLQGEERYKAEFKASKALQDEFMEEDLYVNFALGKEKGWFPSK